jgi:uncharacterized protein YdhG (YjbR/CyaY superfamily)
MTIVSGKRERINMLQIGSWGNGRLIMASKAKAKSQVKAKTKGKPEVIVPGGVDEYIKACPKEVQKPLHEIRGAVQEAGPGAIETVSYFEMPGYSYEGYDYNGMFAWFSYKSPYIRLHVRPPVIDDNMKDIGDYSTTKAIVSFPADEKIPKALVKKLVKASIKAMKDRKKSA